MGDQERISWPERFCIAAVRLILIIILLFLTAVSLVVTCSVHGNSEVIRYGPDRPLFHAALLLLILGIGVWMRKKGFVSGKAFADAGRFRALVLAAAGLCVIWVLITLFEPNSDQRMALESAQALLDGNYLPWAPWGFHYGSAEGTIGYAYTYPSQNGLILFFAAVLSVFGGLTPWVLQVMNIGFLILGILCLSRLYAGIFTVAHMRGTGLLMLAFLPFTFYITFVYGTVPGFGLSSAALYYEYRFLKTGAWRNFFISAVCICVAVLLKSNYLIVLAAMVLFLLTCGLFRKRFRLAAAAFLLVLLYMGSGRVMNLCLETITDEPVSKGVPMLAWVEMGLQEGSRGSGWYNGYNIHVFSDSGLDPELALQMVKDDLRETVRAFREEPERARDFFLKKTASIWAEPTFQSLWVQEVKGDSWLFPELTESLLYEGGAAGRVYEAVFNCVQSLVYMGALLFFLMRRGRLSWEQLLPAVIFIGGFLFHMVWEAKGQYSVCYFILLIPYAVTGLSESADRLYKRLFRADAAEISD